MDTVQPKVDWILKAAKKLTSCACCMPGEGDKDKEDETDKASSSGSEVKVERKTKPVSKAPFYVDGKKTFSFDPIRFSSSQ